MMDAWQNGQGSLTLPESRQGHISLDVCHGTLLEQEIASAWQDEHPSGTVMIVSPDAMAVIEFWQGHKWLRTCHGSHCWREMIPAWQRG